MTKRLEAQMITPIRELMYESFGLDVIVEEFSAGYGIADLVGGLICNRSLRQREDSGLSLPFDQKHLVEVLSLLKPKVRHSLEYLANRISFSENLLRKRIIPQMETSALITVDPDQYVKLLVDLPDPTKHIVAVEAKQTKWQEAIFQARRYRFFADQSYIAVWPETVRKIDRHLLYRHRLGLISVGVDHADVVLEAPVQNPRQPKMNRYCSEFLYRKVLNEREN